jgi:hypothetical protein
LNGYIVIRTSGAMKWYRRMYFKTFEWYREMNGAESLPANYAAAILGALHGINVIALGFVLDLPVSSHSLPYNMAGWLLVGVLLAAVPPTWCSLRADKIEAEFSTEEEVVNPTGRIWVAGYAVASIVALLVAIALRVARDRAGHAG